ncbi:MAG TPA: hypothetical protein VFA26_06435, partial [Gemmataceae bacterium]|nr:hypothetical protein [Gemmataceae bacterium]
QALRLCNRVVVVVRLDVPALRQTRQLLKQLGERGVPSQQVVLVANRYGERGQLPWKRAEEALGAKFAEYVPDDPGKLNSALNQGQPVVRTSPYASVTRRLRKLADLLAGAARK